MDEIEEEINKYMKKDENKHLKSDAFLGFSDFSSSKTSQGSS
jgi:hypothetical protein